MRQPASCTCQLLAVCKSNSSAAAPFSFLFCQLRAVHKSNLAQSRSLSHGRCRGPLLTRLRGPGRGLVQREWTAADGLSGSRRRCTDHEPARSQFQGAQHGGDMEREHVGEPRGPLASDPPQRRECRETKRERERVGREGGREGRFVSADGMPSWRQKND